MLTGEAAPLIKVIHDNVKLSVFITTVIKTCTCNKI